MALTYVDVNAKGIDICKAWKVFHVTDEELLLGAFVREDTIVPRTWLQSEQRPLLDADDREYPSGFHAFRHRNDAELLAEFWGEQYNEPFVVLPVLLKDVHTSGMDEFFHEILVSREMYVGCGTYGAPQPTLPD